MNDRSEVGTRMVKAQLEKAALGELARHIQLVVRPGAAMIDIRLDLGRLARLQLAVSPHDVQRAIVAQRKLKLSFEQVRWVRLAVTSSHTETMSASTCTMSHFKARENVTRTPRTLR